MSSVGSSYSQIPLNAKNFTPTTTVWIHIPNSAADWAAMRGVMPIDEFYDRTSGNNPTFGQGDEFRDMGREIITVNSAGMHEEKYRLVYVLGGNNAGDIEGVSELKGFLRVWAANPDGNRAVKAARTG
jgi:hypothetical protein